MTAFWLGDASPRSTDYALASDGTNEYLNGTEAQAFHLSSQAAPTVSSAPGAFYFEIAGTPRLVLYPDGGASVDGKPVKGRQEVYDGFAKWLREGSRLGANCIPLSADGGPR